MEYRTNRTQSIFNWDDLEDRIKTIQEKMDLLQQIMNVNPHLHYSWETAEDYIGMFKTAAPDNAARMEAHMIDMLEQRNASWTFSDAEYYNPYCDMTKEEFNKFTEELVKKFGL